MYNVVTPGGISFGTLPNLNHSSTSFWILILSALLYGVGLELTIYTSSYISYLIHLSGDSVVRT